MSIKYLHFTRMSIKMYWFGQNSTIGEYKLKWDIYEFQLIRQQTNKKNNKNDNSVRKSEPYL